MRKRDHEREMGTECKQNVQKALVRKLLKKSYADDDGAGCSSLLLAIKCRGSSWFRQSSGSKKYRDRLACW